MPNINYRKHEAMRSSLFRDVMQLRLVLSFRRFGIIFQSSKDGTDKLSPNVCYQIQIYAG